MLGRSRSAAAQANRKVITFRAFLYIDHSNIPLPHVEGVADLEKLFLFMELQFAKRFRPRLPTEAVELLAVDANDVSEIAIPSKNGANHFVKVWEFHAIRNRNEANDHWAHLTENRS